MLEDVEFLVFSLILLLFHFKTSYNLRLLNNLINYDKMN